MDSMLVLSIFFGACFLTGLFSCFVIYPLLAILQQQGYDEKEFLKWAYRAKNPLLKRLALLSLCLCLLTAIFAVCFSFAGIVWANFLAVIPFAGLCVVYYFAGKKSVLKVAFKPTKRAFRLYICFHVVLAVFAFLFGIVCAAIAGAINNSVIYLLRFVPFAIFPLLLPALYALAGLIMRVYETPKNKRYAQEAKEKIAASSCLKIGITGSYGKTSVKRMATQMLQEKFKVIATPHSYNTPLGIARAVEENGLDCEIFLVEMGARRRGDIAELCDMVCPDVGIVTGINAQHLKTFGSLQAIADEKGILIERTARNLVGEGALSCAKESTVSEGKEFSVENVVPGTKGVSFTLNLPDGPIKVNTPLLGKHVAHNLALSAMLCSMLGMSKEEIASAVEKVQPIPHRLELIEQNGAYILDDSYNSNVEGAQDAVETLKLFGGKKFVVTPGLVELGEIEQEENAKLGASFVGLDGVILVGETLVLSLRAGYVEAGGDLEKLQIVPTLERATELLKEQLEEGDCVLFLNDLPDCYC